MEKKIPINTRKAKTIPTSKFDQMLKEEIMS